jgi:hypothetical protein
MGDVRAMQGEPEICNFGHSVMHEYIRNFHIAMYNILPGNVLKSLVDIGDNVPDCGFLHPLSVPELAFEIALVAEFGDNVAVAVAGEDFEASEDVGVVHLFEYFYF